MRSLLAGLLLSFLVLGASPAASEPEPEPEAGRGRGRGPAVRPGHHYRDPDSARNGRRKFSGGGGGGGLEQHQLMMTCALEN